MVFIAVNVESLISVERVRDSMPQLTWDETDFIDYFEVLPRVDDEWETLHVFEIKRENLFLSLGISQFEGTVSVIVRHLDHKEPIVNFLLFVKDSATFVKEKKAKFLELRKCILLPPGTTTTPLLNWGQDFQTFTCYMDVEISINPSIEVRLKYHRSR
jgi:hypothetical protein